ncbi:uncharacterized protein APUU_40661S [Aspergillus puulaauensis]|uniref:LysM domain-containing protein n=1 Tax=Aspergillus puulaauensis TaxID=1220207 RepID=A0A7R7XME7_9EURO|nr:uncharacterized protein APUU_40661S [Aspergillus puulaauensis]BCS24217.1 hypothetical protein APUU_40661S [Aspergillus puulaauensis]
MQPKHLLTGLAPGLVSAAALHLRREVNCDFSTTADAGATCESFADTWGLSVDDLKKLNPAIACPDLDTSKSYCVIGTVTEDPETTSTSTTITSTSTSTVTTTTQPPTSTTSKPTSTNEPQMPGIGDNCDAFYKVKSGDQCDTIAKANSITEEQLKSWNDEINDKCTNLWLDYYVCVHVPGATATSTSPKPTDTPSGPTPQMPGIVSNCKDFHLIEDGGSCWSIYTDAGITLDQFRKWNAEVDAGCTNLWLGYYVCVGI